MTPEEKARELLDKLKPYAYCSAVLTNDYDESVAIHFAKLSSLICVDEIIAVQEDFYGLVLTEGFRDRVRKRVEYWEKVKEELTSPTSEKPM